MRALRELTPAIFMVVVVAFAALMVFEWGMDISGRSTGFPREVGRVNGTSIGYEQWTRVYRALSDQAREQKGSSLTDDELRQVEEAAWNQLVTEILIQQELQRLGIQVTEDEIRLAFRTLPPPQLMSHPAFQTDGQFDYEKYRQYFAGPAADRELLLQIEAYYRDVLPRARLAEQLGLGVYVTDAELWEIWRDRHEQVRADYVMLDPRVLILDDSVPVTDAEIRRAYETRRDEYRREAQAEVAVVSLVRDATPADTAAALARARALRDSLLAGADFAELARRVSADPGSRGAGGDLGFLRREEVVAPVAEAAFSLRLGQVSEPVVSPFGVHLIRVTERRDGQVRASHILLPITLGEESEARLLERVDRLEGIALRRGLSAAADSLDVPVRRALVTRSSEFVPGIGSLAAAVDWALHDSTLVGEASPVYETRAGFHMLELLDRTPAGVLPLEQVRGAVERRVRLEKKKERTRGIAESIARSARTGGGLAAAAGEHGLDVRTTPLFTRLDFVPDLGQANAAIGTAFGLPVGRVGDPVEANDRFYVLQVTERVPADAGAFARQREPLRAQLMLQRREMQWELYFRELREKAKIRDFRRELFGPRS